MKGEIFMQKIPKPLLKAMLRVSAYRMKRQEEKRFQAAVREKWLSGAAGYLLRKREK